MLYFLHDFHLLLRSLGAPDWLSNLAESALNIFQYHTFRAGAAAMTAFVISILVGDWVILRLKALKLGQPIRTKEEVHKLAELHGGKKGTPTMGGILIIGSVVISGVLWADSTNLLVWIGLALLLLLGYLGFLDDYAKVKKKTSAGVSGKVKLAVQLGVAIGLTAFFYFYNNSAQDQDLVERTTLAEYPGIWQQMSSLHVPFFKEALIPTMGIFTFIFFALVIMGTSNGANLTDGLDGLAIGCTITTAGAFAALNYAAGNAKIADYLQIPYTPYSSEIAVLCAALVGASLGFLWFNCYPAKVFMGDTGSLAIGGFIGFTAITCKQEFLLVIIGGIFVLEALSVILQVASFKLRGRRIFKMAPLHHHFELSGWKESTVIVRFWIMSALFALLGLATLKLR